MNLNVTIPSSVGEIPLKNPLMPAAATLGNLIEHARYFDLNELGAMLPNSMFIDSGSPTTAKKICKTNNGFISALSKNNMSIFEFKEEIIPYLPWKTTPLIIDMKATDMYQMEKLAAAINDIKEIKGIEINLNCPYGPGTPYWQNSEQLKDLVRRVRNAAPDKWLIAKVPGGDIPVEQISTDCQAGGADAVTSYSSLNGSVIDIYTRKYRCGGGGSGGFSGPAFKPVGLLMCRRAVAAVDIPVIGIGGISCAEDVIEYIMAGAYAVQVGSANLSRPDFMPRLIKDLENLMQKLGINSFEEIRGTAQVE
ncbi:MAG TPA: nitronate monooxygenase [Candidatus Mediterraneibacter cottocaccae]|nr:nitronate monooxygenase [Candidatus Mediterraneibacter cottocaccae]